MQGLLRCDAHEPRIFKSRQPRFEIDCAFMILPLDKESIYGQKPEDFYPEATNSGVGQRPFSESGWTCDKVDPAGKYLGSVQQ